MGSFPVSAKNLTTTTGTQSIPQSEVNARIISVFDYMTPAQRADVKARTCAVDVTAALQAAIDANINGTIRLEPGIYRVTGLTISDVITIVGVRNSFKTSGSVWASTIRNFSTTNPCFSFAAGTYHPGVIFKDFSIIGAGSGTATPNGATDVGILFQGQGQHIFENLQITQCGGYGIKAIGVTNKAVIRGSKITKCTAGGIYLVNDKAGGGILNTITVQNCEIDTNWSDGIRVYADSINLLDNTIQGNTGYGINVSSPDTTDNQFAYGISIQNNYFEINTLGHIYGQAYAVSNRRWIRNLHIFNNYFTTNLPVTDINLTCADGTVAYLPYTGCRILGNAHVASSVRCYVNLNGFHGATTTLDLQHFTSATDFAQKYQGLGTAATNGLSAVGCDSRWTNGPDATSAYFPCQYSYDNIHNVMMMAVTVGNGWADWRPMMPYFSNAAPTRGCFKRGTMFHNTAAASGSTPFWVQTSADGSGSYGSVRANTTAYSASSSTWIAWNTGTTVYECTKSGTSAGSEPAAASAVGQVLTDGTAEFTCRALTRATWVAAANLP